MQSTSRHYFEKFLTLSLRMAVGFAIFCAVTGVFSAALGWLRLLPPMWTGAVAGLLAALIFDRFAWSRFDFDPLNIWRDAPRWQFVAVLAVFLMVLVVAGYFLLVTFSVDPLCHHGVTNSILAFGAPARDLGAPERFLPYHALGNLLAASIASAVLPTNPSSVVELSLDIVSFGSLAVFLAGASVFFVCLIGIFCSVHRVGPLWLCFVYPLLVFGTGPVALAHLMPDVLASADCYPDFGALSFHPMVQYLARRSAVSAFAVFLAFLCVLLLAVRGVWANRWIPFSIFAACFVVLFYSSLDLAAVAAVLVVCGLYPRSLRSASLVASSALLFALPFVAIQGGFVTASLFNQPLPEAQTFSAWQFRFPSLVGFFRPGNLGGLPLSDPLAVKVLAVDLPWFLLSLPLALWLLRRQPASAGRSWLFLLLALAFVLLVLPFVLFFSFSPWDIHRLFFWPTLFAALLTPFVLRGLIDRHALRTAIAALLLVVSCSSSLARIFVKSPTENNVLNANAWLAAQEFRSRLGFDPQRGKTWLASPGAEGLLFMNGARVLAPAFGSAGPVLYRYDLPLLGAVLQRALTTRNAGGATHGLLTTEDLVFYRQRSGGPEPAFLQEITLVSNERPMKLFLVRWTDAPEAE